MLDILVCDDNEAILSQINELLLSLEAVYNTKFNIILKSSAEAVFENESNYDIAFIDIELPGASGLNLAEELKRHNPDVIVIVVTSFQNYLDDAMRIHVFRYLSKPIDPQRFSDNFSDALTEYKSIGKTIIIEVKNKVYQIRTKDILYIENRKHGSLMATKNEIILSNEKPKELYALINQPKCFVYSHNSFMVNLQNVIDFDKKSVTLRKNDKETVSAYMSQRKYAEFKKAFLAFAGGI